MSHHQRSVTQYKFANYKIIIRNTENTIYGPLETVWAGKLKLNDDIFPFPHFISARSKSLKLRLFMTLWHEVNGFPSPPL